MIADNQILTRKELEREVNASLTKTPAKTQTKAIDNNGLIVNAGKYDDLSPEQQELMGPNIDPQPIIRKAPKGKYYEGEYGAFVILGKDMDGKGGLWDQTGAGAIHLVAGPMSADPRNDRYYQTNFKSDAAKILLTQKGNVDEYLSLPPGTIGDIKSKSAIALNADSTRVCARSSIKIVAGTDTVNSKGAQKWSRGLINLIAMGHPTEGIDMQPVVKGQNLVDCLSGILDYIGMVRNEIYNFMEYQGEINDASAKAFLEISSALKDIASHNHQANAGGPIAPSITLKGSLPSKKTAVNQSSRSVSTENGKISNQQGDLADKTTKKTLEITNTFLKPPPDKPTKNSPGVKYICSDGVLTN
jgi:hypothetical protein